jgi:tyrosyl-DNA phosphodiesterase 2
MSVSKTTPKTALTSGPAQSLGDAHHKPRPQPFYHYNGSNWDVTPQHSSQSGRLLTTNLRVVSWNIDMLIGFAEERMSAALKHLHTLVESTSREVPVVIFLQEMSQSDMRQIRDASFIQRRFHITDLDERNWLSPLYGTNTLIDRRLSIKSVFRVPWISKFDRDGLFVDLALSGQGEGKVLRLCNTHLESLIADPPVRPLQLQAAAQYLHDSSVATGLLAGDLNAIQPFDRTLHCDNNLKDVYLELGGQEDSDDGYTWGYQVPQAVREKFGCSRMDKILFSGAVRPQKFERIGAGVKVAVENRQQMRDAGEEEWVTDHYGVMVDLQLEEQSALAVTDEMLRSKLT